MALDVFGLGPGSVEKIGHHDNRHDLTARAAEALRKLADAIDRGEVEPRGVELHSGDLGSFMRAIETGQVDADGAKVMRDEPCKLNTLTVNFITG